MSYCYDCFKEQRSRGDILKQIKFDAKEYADKEHIEVAIIQEAEGYRFERINGHLPAGTIEIVIPM